MIVPMNQFQHKTLHASQVRGKLKRRETVHMAMIDVRGHGLVIPTGD